MGADEICAMSLGPPIRPAKPEGPEWVVVDPSRPHIERNTKTGMWRNVRPEPPPVPWLPIP